jgi:hypothetical protein
LIGSIDDRQVVLALQVEPDCGVVPSALERRRRLSADRLSQCQVALVSSALKRLCGVLDPVGVLALDLDGQLAVIQ